MKEFNDWFKSQYGSSDILIQGMVKEIAKESWMAANGAKKEEKYKNLTIKIIELLKNPNGCMPKDIAVFMDKYIYNNIEDAK